MSEQISVDREKIEACINTLEAMQGVGVQAARTIIAVSNELKNQISTKHEQNEQVNRESTEGKNVQEAD